MYILLNHDFYITYYTYYVLITYSSENLLTFISLLRKDAELRPAFSYLKYLTAFSNIFMKYLPSTFL